MADGKRDGNSEVVLMGVSSVDGVTPLPFKVDPATGRLLCYFAAFTGASKVPSETGKRDGNSEVVLMGEVNGTTVPAPFIMDGNNLMFQNN